MNEERAKRGLKAIFSADVKGYSRLIGEDELGTVNRLKEYRQIIASHLERCNGRLVDSPGDNILAEFTSVVDAVECAVDVQNELKKHNEVLSSDEKMEFRIGINLGDVIEDGNRIYGDGVNVAARIEGLAEPGGICISRTAYDQIGKKLPYGYAYLGEHSVKNIDKPVRVYRVLTEPDAAGKVIGEKRFLTRLSLKVATAAIIVLVIVAGGLLSWIVYIGQTKKVEAASLDRMAYPLPDKPSIAVLPFDNLTGDPDLEYLSDGLTEEIISGLAILPQLFVIARNSTFTYKGKPVKVQQISEELGVRYVLEGSVRGKGEHVRVTAQLIDAIKGYHIWSERYDRELGDILVLQDDIMKNILMATRITLIEGEQLRYWQGDTPPEKLDLKMLETKAQIEWHFGQNTPEANERAKQLAIRLIEMYPNHPGGYLLAANILLHDIMRGIASRESFALAGEYAQKAVQLDENLGPARSVLGLFYFFTKRLDLARTELEKAVALEPNGAIAHLYLGNLLHFLGSQEEAIRHIEMAIRLNPSAPASYYSSLGVAYAGRVVSGHNDLEKAIECCKKALKMNPNEPLAHLKLIEIYSYQNRMKEARFHVAERLRLTPNWSIKLMQRNNLYKDEYNEATEELFRKAGVPEG